MKILRVITSMDPKSGGPCEGIRNIIPSLSKHGILNDIVCLDNPDAPYLQKDLLTIYALGPTKTALKYAPKLRPWLKKNIQNYDVVILHGLWQYPTFCVRHVIKSLKKQQPEKVPQVFVMPHGMLDPWFQKDKSRRIKAIRNTIYWHLVEKKVINNADGLLFTCQEELELAKTTFNDYRPKSVTNIGYGIAPPPQYKDEMKAFFEKHHPSVKNKKYLLFLSRIHPKKGVDLLLDAYRHVLINNTQHFIPDLVIAGPGLGTPYGKDMFEKVNQSPILKKRVHFVGMVADDVKWGAMYGCEAFILPSHQENFGIAVVEALACKKPVFITPQVNIWQQIQAVGAGIVHEDTLQGTIKSLEHFISMSSNEREHMKKQALFAYQQFFDIRVTAHNLVKTINKLTKTQVVEYA